MQEKPSKKCCYPAPLVVNAQSDSHLSTCILLHGRGSNAERFGLEFLKAKTSDGKTLGQCFPCMKFIFPTAKKRRSNLLSRMQINQWFDNYSLEDPSQKEYLQVAGLQETMEFVHEIIRKESRIVGVQNVIVGGLSQGCSMALHVMLTFEDTLGGFVGMSGWLPFRKSIDFILAKASGNDSEEDDSILFEFLNESGRCEDETTEQMSDGRSDPAREAVNFVRENLSLSKLTNGKVACLETPVFVGHGETDEKVSFQLGEGIVFTLSSLGMDVTWKSYPRFGHWYKVPDEIDDIVLFLKRNALTCQNSCG